MQSISGIIYIILAACLLPYLFAFIARVFGKFKLSNNQNPREFLAKTTGVVARANAVQQNSFEGLPLFIAAILMAEYMVVNQFWIMFFGMTYIVLRVLYGLCYLANWSNLRSVIWILSMLCPISLFILIIKITS